MRGAREARPRAGIEGRRLPVAQDDSVVGCIGVLTVATRGAAGPGEVLIKFRGGSEAFIAWSPEPISRGSSVLVINNRGTRAVDVSEWADPLSAGPGDRHPDAPRYPLPGDDAA